jgi:Fe-S-cluster-containing hydrogenase component 2
MEDQLFFDPMKCVDCKICELACSFANQGINRDILRSGFHSPETGINTLSLQVAAPVMSVKPIVHRSTGSAVFMNRQNSRGGMVVKRGPF